MNELLLHPQTAQAIDAIKSSLPHAIMLTGNEGSGKRHVALSLAADILNAPLKNHAYFMHIEPEGKAMTIGQIRELQRFVRLKTAGTSNIRRVALLTDAHLMTIEAQNALLKLLEEPPEDTVLIITAQGDKALKPTIYSRVQKVHIRPINRQDALVSAGASPEAEKAYLLSGGDAGLFQALIDENENHPLVSAIKDTKDILMASTFDRLVRIDELSKDKERLSNILTALKRIADASLKQAASKNDTKLKKRWLRVLDAVYACEKLHTSSNANTKLLLTDLFLSI